jgi:phosphohistidine swiveling domain-containing protein
MDRDEGGTPDLVPTHAVSLRGNSLNIDDITPFTARRTIATEHMATTGFEKWWSSLPHWKQIGFTPHIERARGYVKLREYARMLSVRLIDNLRTTIEDQATVLFPETKDLLFFATIEEIIGGEVVKSRCEERQREYKERLPLVMPQYVASFVKAPTNSHCVGVSPGIAEGVIVARENLNDNPQEKILYTERLTPDIVQYFSSIKGIVSQHGGILSHLAIMARESGIPVLVTNGSFSTPLGKRCRINGLTGEVTVLDS